MFQNIPTDLEPIYNVSNKLVRRLAPPSESSPQKTNSNATHLSAGQRVFEMYFLKSREKLGNQVSKCEMIQVPIINIFKTLLLFLVTLEVKISNQNNKLLCIIVYQHYPDCQYLQLLSLRNTMRI